MAYEIRDRNRLVTQHRSAQEALERVNALLTRSPGRQATLSLHFWVADPSLTTTVAQGADLALLARTQAAPSPATA